jgi:hypothetical protein
LFSVPPAPRAPLDVAAIRAESTAIRRLAQGVDGLTAQQTQRMAPLSALDGVMPTFD